MIATDVAARGLDVKGVMAVINFDMAGNVEDYVHRIGRTGRAGEKGTAHTFFGRSDAGKARQLIKVASDAGQQIPEQLHQFAAMGGGGGKGRHRGGKGGGGGYGGGGGGFGGGGFGGGGGAMRGGGGFGGGNRFNPY